MKTILFFFLFAPVLLMGQIQYDTYSFEIDFNSESKPYPNYWNSTGFTPGDLFLQKDMQQTLDYLSAIPNEGLRYVRPHWMLNLVGSRNIDKGNPVFNFEKLDAALDEMVNRGLKPIFEVMGYPSLTWDISVNQYDDAAQGQKNQSRQWIPDFSNEDELMQWHEFVKLFVKHLENRYGEEELKAWYFECTNEPDIGHFWKKGIPELLNYWDATSEAIKSVNEDYIFGGPGTARGLSDEFKAVLEHCEKGINAITGEKGAVLDFISVHRKFRPYEMIDREAECINYIREHHPVFSGLPFWNNEADPMAGWSKQYWWRAHPWYGAFVTQSVNAHNRFIIDSMKVNYHILSNDNGFMGDWYKRTHLARYKNQEDPEQFWLFKKPVLTVMTMLALSEGQRYEVKGYKSTRQNTVLDASRAETGEIVLILTNKPEFGPVHNNWVSQKDINPEQKKMHDSQGAIVQLQLRNVDIENPVMTYVNLNYIHGNPHNAWEQLGEPDTISAEMYKTIAANMDPVIMESLQVNDFGNLRVTMPPSSISMIIISEEKQNAPSTPEITGIKDYKGFNGETTKFIRWEQVNDGIALYNVFASYDGGPFEIVNPYPLFDCGYLDVMPDNANDVVYRIEARYIGSKF